MMGTIMVANVFFVIIPGQRGMVRAMQEGREPDPELGLKGRLRSITTPISPCRCCSR